MTRTTRPVKKPARSAVVPKANSIKKGMPSAATLSAKGKAKASANASKAVANKTVEGIPAKPVSQVMLDAIARHKRAKAKLTPLLLKPGGKRRGRKPKNIDFTGEQQEEDAFNAEPELERIEFDTGIQLNKAKDDPAVPLGSTGELDEELNFDWK